MIRTKRWLVVALILCCNAIVVSAAPFPTGRNSLLRTNHLEQNRFAENSMSTSKFQDSFDMPRETDNLTSGQLRMGGDPADPGKTPVGDLLWLPALLGLIYGVSVFGRKKV